MAAATFLPPQVDPSEIAYVIQSWGYPVTEEDLIPPKGLKPEIIQMVYACAITKLTGLTIMELEESAERSLAAVDEWQDLIAPSARLHVLLYHAYVSVLISVASTYSLRTRIAEGAAIEDFSMMDLVAPTYARTHRILSAIVNFGRFSEERYSFIERLQQQHLKASEERDDLQQQVIDLRQKIQEHKAKLNADEPVCAQLVAENQVGTAKLRELYEEQSAVFQESESLKMDREGLAMKKNGIQDEIEVALDTNARMKARIVQSPERLKRIINTMGENVFEERRNIAANEAKTRGLKAKLDVLAGFEQDLQANLRHLATLASEHDTLEASVAKLARSRAELEKQTVMRNELALEQERAERRKGNAEERLGREQKYAEEQRLKSQITIANLKKEFEEMSLERRDNDQAVEETKREAAEIERKMAEHLRQNEEEMHKLLTEYWRLRHQAEVYMETLANKLGLDFQDE
ncbi:hypothetical protein Clacol_006272 [Clathrus columnatus]|uniref:Uncharacterized protein n=1 Tax=Clathrus columnatus TaxID=1419009 RepID=A0AAV5ABL2_9AGAM|nr:hypothetical protein Clacol_006272 [Clathrus columnatus]